MIHVVSTGFRAPTKPQCLESVALQQFVKFQHWYIEAGDQKPPQDVITNLASVIRDLPPRDIVVLLDGDDWLEGPYVLSRVQEMHKAGAWVTWGSFDFSDGRPGFAAPLDWSVPVRAHPWVTTHLKTIRAGLFQQLREEDMTWPSGAPVPWDMVIMFAALEMAGEVRSTFCPKTLCIYNFANSNERKNGPSGERAIEQEIRARRPYAQQVTD